MQHLRGRWSADDIPAWEAPTVGSARLPCTHTGDDPRSLQTSPKVAMNHFMALLSVMFDQQPFIIIIRAAQKHPVIMINRLDD